MKNGGYTIIDLKGKDLNQPFTIDGIYNAIEGNNHKAILLSGIVIDSIEKADVFINEYSISNSNYVIDVYDKTITINADDQVSAVDGGKHLYKVEFNCSDYYFLVYSKIPLYLDLFDGDVLSDNNYNLLKNFILNNKGDYYGFSSQEGDVCYGSIDYNSNTDKIFIAFNRYVISSQQGVYINAEIGNDKVVNSENEDFYISSKKIF